jgi:hypothetical protein
MEGSMRIVHLVNLEERLENKMEHMDNKMEKGMGHIDNNMEMIAKLIQNPEEKIHKGGDVSQGTQEDKDSAHIEQPSINKHSPRGFDSNNGSSQVWSTRGIQLLKNNMSMFDGKDPITWIF